MQSVCDHSPTPILMVGDGRGSDTTIHPPSNHWGLGRSVFYRADLCDWLRGLYGLGGDEWNEALIRVGVVAGLEPGEWVPSE